MTKNSKHGPNILVLFADQLRPFELGCHGHPVVKTPNIDRLASLGVRFDVACTNNPVCTPARSTLISGQYGRTCTGMLGCCGNPSDRRSKFPDTTLPELLSIGYDGYETFACGKWHIEPNPLRLGFEHAFYPLVNHLNVGQTYFDGTGKASVVEGYCPDTEVETSCDFIRKPRQRPFFLYHNMALPHMPFFDVPQRYLEKYSPEQAVLRPNVFREGQLWHDEHAMKVYWTNWLYMEKVDPKYDVLPKGFDLRKMTALYYGMITAVDDQVGAILDCLEETGQLENTVILLTSDHGENLGSHWLWNKISVNDEAVRIPFIIACPSTLKPQVVTRHVASLVDVAPTLLSLAGRPVPAHLQGRDLSPILRGETGTIEDGGAIIENLFGEIAIRTPDHLFSIMTRSRPEGPQREVVDEESLFFDMCNDPYQLHNLAGDGFQTDVVDALRRRVLDWDRQTPWMHTSDGGLYAQGGKHDFPPRPKRCFG